MTKYQENTLAAVKASIDSPYCNGTEFDVFLTKDNKVVLFHDESLKRVTGVDRSIYDMTWDDLKTIPILDEIEVDGGLRKYDKQESIPLLEDVLEELVGEIDDEKDDEATDIMSNRTAQVVKVIMSDAFEQENRIRALESLPALSSDDYVTKLQNNPTVSDARFKALIKSIL